MNHAEFSFERLHVHSDCSQFLSAAEGYSTKFATRGWIRVKRGVQDGEDSAMGAGFTG